MTSPLTKGTYAWMGLLGVVMLCIPVFLLPHLLASSYKPSSEGPAVKGLTSSEEDKVPHIDTPEPLKALYMTACVATTPSWRQRLIGLIESTELNAVVIDIKDSTGGISFDTGLATPGAGGCIVTDMKEFIADLHESEIYVIGRISVFQDPAYAELHPDLAVKSQSTGGVWKDRKGLSFIDVGARPYWDHIVELSRASYNIGFDEINFDYVRYPSDGNMRDTRYDWTATTSSTVSASLSTPGQSFTGDIAGDVATGTSSTVRAATKAEMLESFFAYLHENLQTYKLQNLKTSADLFGMTMTVENDMNIGQVLERALPYFDYIAPMVYPSHYPKGWHGFANPAEHPYDVIGISMSRAVEREQAWLVSNNLATSTTSKLRPWLQDFDLGAEYDASKVRAQIQATYDIGLTSWMLWNAGNRYTESALLPN